MSARPTVSVVIPCYNLGRYLDQAIGSVLGQTYGDFEILVIDDGSTDEATQHLFRSFRRPKTRVLRTPNRGVMAARNLGIAEARGQFVSCLDADDLLEPRFLERLIAPLGADPSLGFASCWLTAFGDNQFAWQPDACDFPTLLAECTVCTAALTRRGAILAVGGYDEDMPMPGYEDWDLGISLVEGGFRGCIVPEFLFRYRIRRGSLSSVCMTPDSHIMLYRYLLQKHRSSYRRHFAALLEIAERRTAALTGEGAGWPSAARPLGEVNLAREGASRIPATAAVSASAAHEVEEPFQIPEEWEEILLAKEDRRRRLEVGSAEEPVGTDEAPAVGSIAWGSFRRREPISFVWGLDRGKPVDRHYIERFLEGFRADIRGRVLEVKDAGYTRTYGTAVERADVVDVVPENVDATLIADLAVPGSLPEDAFDCFILTQTIHIIYDYRAVLRNARRTLRAGGVLLATLPSVSRLDYESGLEGDFWRFTPASAQALFRDVFSAPDQVEVASFGNVQVCCAFLHGLAAEELEASELDHRDPYFPLVLGVRAVKAAKA